MDLFNRERSRGGGGSGRQTYAQALQDQANMKSMINLSTAGEKTETKAKEDEAGGQGIIGATKAYEGLQKVKARLGKNKLVSAVADRAGAELDSRAPGVMRTARRIGSAIDGGVSRASALTSGAGATGGSAGRVDAGASSAVADEEATPASLSDLMPKAGARAVRAVPLRQVPNYMKTTDPRYAGLSDAERDANTRLRVTARENMTSNIRDRLRARTGTASRDMTALTGGDADRQSALDQVRRTLGGSGNPPTTNPHAQAPVGGDDASSRLTPNTGRPADLSTPSTGQTPATEPDAGVPSTRPQALAGAGDDLEEGASTMGKVMSGVGEAMDFLGPIGDLIGIGLSIFGGVEAGKASDEKAQAQSQAEAQANKAPVAPVGKAIGATLDTARAMPVSQVHF